jgi:hypothetical protein
MLLCAATSRAQRLRVVLSRCCEGMRDRDHLRLVCEADGESMELRTRTVVNSAGLHAVDVARLNPDGMRTAHKLADVLQQNPTRTVLIEGYTDSTGTAPHNQELSERRAGAVRTALQTMGVAGGRVTARGNGQPRSRPTIRRSVRIGPVCRTAGLSPRIPDAEGQRPRQVAADHDSRVDRRRPPARTFRSSRGLGITCDRRACRRALGAR